MSEENPKEGPVSLPLENVYEPLEVRMNTCTIVVCEKPPTWQGYLSTKDGKHGKVVRYCDEHAHTQINSVPRNLRLSLDPIKGKV